MTETMQHRRLGRSGLRVTELTFGTWLGADPRTAADNAHACIRRALEEGISTFDTADVYNQTAAESLLGDALRVEARASLVIMTKAFWPVGAPSPNNGGLSRKHLREAIDASLRRLNTDYVDVYFAHRFDYGTELEETMLAYADLVRAGKVLYVGVSEWTGDQIARAAELARELHVPLVASQPQYSMLWRVPEAEVFPASETAGIGQMIWSPLAQGALTGKYRAGVKPPAGSRAGESTEINRLMQPFMRDEVLAAIEKLHPIAEQAGLTTSQLAIAWTLNNPQVSTAIIGASRPDQIAEARGAIGAQLDEAVITAIDEALASVIIDDPQLTSGYQPAVMPKPSAANGT